VADARVEERLPVSGHEDEYNEALKGIRLIHAFGKWYGSFTLQSDGLICESCGLSSWQYEWDLSKWVSQWVRDQEHERGP